MFIALTGAQYQFRENDYVTTEGVNSSVQVVVQQISASSVDIHLKLTTYTYAQYTQRANKPGSGLAPLSRYHGSLPPDSAERKHETFIYTQHACINNKIFL